MFKAAFLVMAALIAAATPVLAESCDGTLKRIGGDLVLGPLPHEREGTCIIAKADQPRVLQACRLNKRCIVSGKMQLCTEAGIEAGECVYVSNVVGARRR